jgi:hypothetical protein
MPEGLRVAGLVAGAWAFTGLYFAIPGKRGGGKVWSNTFHVAICLPLNAAGFEPQPTCDRRANAFRIQGDTFDRARFDRFFRQSF